MTYIDRSLRIHYLDSTTIPGFPADPEAFDIGPDGTKWITTSTPPYKLFALRDIDPKPRALHLATGLADTLFEASTTSNIVLQDSSHSIALGVEKVKWSFPPGSGIAPGDTLTGLRRAINITQPGRYRVRVRVTDSTMSYSDTAFTLTVLPTGTSAVAGQAPLWAWPNPSATGVYNLEGMAPNQPALLQDALGKTVRHLQPGAQRLDIAELPTGMYLLRQGGRTARVLR